jgi:carbon monoxide dehydrogenase subunit G
VRIEVTSHELAHPRERVFALLLDPAALARLLPGVEKLEPTGPDQYAVVVQLGVGAVRGTYTGKVAITEQRPPEGYRLAGEARGTPGWAKGGATLTLLAEGAGTRIAAKADVQIGGAIASVGQRMIEGVAKSMAREFFQSLDRELAGSAAGQAAAPVSAAGFGFRVLLDLVRRFFARLLGRRDAP